MSNLPYIVPADVAAVVARLRRMSPQLDMLAWDVLQAADLIERLAQRIANLEAERARRSRHE